jgi:hypothetical protein
MSFQEALLALALKDYKYVYSDKASCYGQTLSTLEYWTNQWEATLEQFENAKDWKGTNKKDGGL